MFGGDVNTGAVLAVTVVSFIFSFLWYGPLFGKLWVKLSKIPAIEVAKAKKKGMKGMWRSMVLGFFGTFVMAYIFSEFISLLGMIDVLQAAVLGFWIWLAFFACTTLLNATLWEGKSWSLFAFNAFYWIINLMLIGILIVVWG